VVEGGCSADLAADLDRVHEGFEVVRLGQQVRVDQRRGGGVGGGQPQGAPGQRAHDPGRDRVAVLGHRVAVGGQHHVDEEGLEVGDGPGRVGPGEELRLQQVAGAGRQRAARRVDVADEQVVVQVLADTGQVGPDGDAEFGEVVGRTDPAVQQDPRGADRAAAEDGLAGRPGLAEFAAGLVLHPDGAARLQEHAVDLGAGGDGEAQVVQDGGDEARPGAHPPVVGDGDVVVADAGHLLAVEVLDERVAQGERRLDERARGGVRVGDAGDRQVAARAVPGPGAVDVVLRALEQRQDAVPVPARAALVGPGVVVGAVPAHVDHAVERAAAAEHASARPVQGAPGGVLLRDRHHGPVDVGVPEAGPAARVVDGRCVVGGTRLHDVHGVARVQEPAGEDAARGAGADDDDVVLCGCGCGGGCGHGRIPSRGGAAVLGKLRR
jgi:hypothetical protein